MKKVWGWSWNKWRQQKQEERDSQDRDAILKMAGFMFSYSAERQWAVWSHPEYVCIVAYPNIEAAKWGAMRRLTQPEVKIGQ